MKITFEFKLQDFYIGLFWKQEKCFGQGEFIKRYHIWVCLIPCFPIHLTTRWKIEGG